MRQQLSEPPVGTGRAKFELLLAKVTHCLIEVAARRGERDQGIASPLRILVTHTHTDPGRGRDLPQRPYSVGAGSKVTGSARGDSRKVDTSTRLLEKAPMTDSNHQGESGPARAHRTKHVVVVPNSINMVSLLGPGDEHLGLIERSFDAEIHVRGNRI